jgi:hypothetical protein
MHEEEEEEDDDEEYHENASILTLFFQRSLIHLAVSKCPFW